MVKISCEIVEDLCLLYLHNACSHDSRRLVEEHIATCTECREKLEIMKQDISTNPDIPMNQRISDGAESDVTDGNIRRRLIGTIFMIVMATVLFFGYIYRDKIFQEGNPVYYTKAFVHLALSSKYVDISEMDGSGDTKFMTRRDGNEELFQYIEKKYNVKFDNQVDSGYQFKNDTSSLKVTCRSYLKFFTVWEVGGLKIIKQT